MLAGEEFNVNSPAQLGEILFEKMGLKHGKKTKTGYSTSADVLEELRAENEIIAEILDYRQVMKLNSTYCEGLIKVADESGKIHTTFNQTVAVTGRLSSTEPNLQNIPVRTELGRNFRKYFITKNEDVGPFGRLVGRDEMEIGDVIQLGRNEEGYYHTLIAVGFDGEDVLVAAQTDNAYARPLSSYDYDYSRFIKILGIRFEMPDAYSCFDELMSE
jgi:hypothetical protein